ncbi:MAG: hypothetical protein OXI22_10915 [Defluviicoccus sp.]|nr:hypothetical protein [Defluviicoccus sp.]
MATGREHGPFDSEADVALCLAFEKLARDQVEIAKDASLMARFVASGNKTDPEIDRPGRAERALAPCNWRV